MEWTEKQKEAIYKKGSNILVAAAAGSGKTAVLVERIINKILNEKVDIDKILVVTFTNAAASEMRERILNALYKKIEENEDIEELENLQKQVLLINKASICTIDSFCLDVIRNNFFEIDISPNFRVADTPEIELLKKEVMEELFEEKYESQDEKFQKLIKTYTSYRDDTPLKELLFRICSYISSNPYPEKWITEQIEKFNIKNIDEDFSETMWGKILLEEVKEEVIDDIFILETEAKKLSVEKDLLLFQKTIENDITELQTLLINLDNWDKAYTIANSIEFITWPRNKVDIEEKEIAKEIRDNTKKKFKSKVEKIFVSNSKEALQDIKDMYGLLKDLRDLLFEFQEKFNQKKKERNILDFTDVEHKALEILVKENEDGRHIRSDVAKRYQEKFVEIAIDEYQDSNLIQEYILGSVSRENNIFMVGDVKQSIYRFRQAMPELFLDKYKKYSLNNTNANGLKIQLFSNFRSRKNILEFTNAIFQKLMSEELGDINYNKEEYLNLGAKWNEENLKNEIDIIDLKEKEETNFEEEKEEDTEEQEEKNENIENTELEAKLIAKKIKNLVDNKFQIYDVKTGEKRDVKYKDIVILLRSTKGKASVYESELMNLKIPVYSDTSSVYIDSMEIQTIMSLLKIIDNPMQDIPLVMVMRSSIGKFTDNELVEIRISDQYSDFYTAMLKAKLSAGENLRKKIQEFTEKIEKWREEQEYLSLDELIWKIYEETGFLNYVGILPNGELRQANLKMLFERAKEYEGASFKGLFNFIRFIEGLNLGSGDLSSAKIIGENENVVRIMSIHKSKGLEFPIVFLASSNTNFNLTDLNDDILLNQKLGLGVKYIDYDMQIKYDTLTKLALRDKEFEALLAEEMRILYVALTRAKEKLYIVGIKKDYEKDREKMENFIKAYKGKENKLNPILIKKYKNYLDWIQLVLYSEFDKMQELSCVNVYNKEDITNDLKSEDKEKFDILKFIEENLKKVKDEEVKEIEEKLNFKYKYEEETKIPSKTSITAIAHKNKEEVYVNGVYEESSDTEDYDVENIEFPTPKFLNNEDEERISSAKKGTIMHLCMKNLNVSTDYTIDKIRDVVKELIDKEIITQKEGESVNVNQVLQFTRSNIWKELKEAKEIYKEQPFYINISANEVIDVKTTENILAQGIIDLYYINKNDELVLVDYKTDFIKKGEEDILIKRYKPQLTLYKEALENALNKKVKKIYIYSTVLGKECEI